MQVVQLDGGEKETFQFYAPLLISSEAIEYRLKIGLFLENRDGVRK